MTSTFDLYDRTYFLGDCEGCEEFRLSRGRKLTRRLKKCLALVAAKRGDCVVDVGCGRGELALHLAEAGAEVVAVDPSIAALELLAEAIDSWYPSDSESRAARPRRPLRVRACGQQLPLGDSWANAVVLSDVVEHLSPGGLRRLLGEVTRVLRPGGRLVVHTQPNRTLVRVTVPVLSRVSRLWGVSLPRDLRSEMTPGSGPAYHPGEQSIGSLRRALMTAGLSIENLWLEGSYAVHRLFGDGRGKDRVLRAFRKSRLLKRLLATQIFAVAMKGLAGA